MPEDIWKKLCWACEEWLVLFLKNKTTNTFT